MAQKAGSRTCKSQDRFWLAITQFTHLGRQERVVAHGLEERGAAPLFVHFEVAGGDGLAVLLAEDAELSVQQAPAGSRAALRLSVRRDPVGAPRSDPAATFGCQPSR